MMTRREFLKLPVYCAAGAALSSLLPTAAAWAGTSLAPYTKEARYYQKLPMKKVQCLLCPRECKVGSRERGYCGVRENRDGTYYTLVHGNPCSVHADPIEKKPFFHFLPGTKALSFSTAGCNLNCRFCQNWEISQARPENVQSISMRPKDAVAEAKRSGCRTLVGTYAEPTVYYEYMLDVAKEGQKAGLKTAIVSSGFIRPEPLRELCRHIDAVKIDLKAFDEEFYRRICVGELAPVLESLKTAGKAGVHLEIVNLVIPTLNDSAIKIKEMCEWIKKHLGNEVPVHFTRFHPIYKLNNLPSTPVKTLKNAQSAATQAGLTFAYVGNVPGDAGENTICPGCKKVIIERMSYVVTKIAIKNGRCSYCNQAIPGVWS
ncbi:MAG: AmmeMemoRadiSam system radical SAM enzyme [Vulcanimicrobiota bacterium]